MAFGDRAADADRRKVATVAAANRAVWLAEPEAPLDPDPATEDAADEVEGGDTESADALEEIDEQRLAA